MWALTQEPGTSSSTLGLGYIDGQPYPMGWPSDRQKIVPSELPPMTLLEAFQWPKVVKANLNKILENFDTEDGNPLITQNRRLQVTSHFSGVCTQSHAAQVLQSNGMGTFDHVRDPF